MESVSYQDRPTSDLLNGFFNNTFSNTISKCDAILAVCIGYFCIISVCYGVHRIMKKGKQKSGKEFSPVTYNVVCPICFNDIQDPVRSSCGHMICLDCLYNYFISSNSKLCPYCREHLNNLQIIENEEFEKMDKQKRKELKDTLRKVKQMQQRTSRCWNAIKRAMCIGFISFFTFIYLLFYLNTKSL